MRPTILIPLLSLMLAIPPAARAVTISLEASDNATVQPAGPRTGANGKAFFNMEGSTAGGASFSSFGVADFTFPAQAVTGITSISLQMAQSNAAFSAMG